MYSDNLVSSKASSSVRLISAASELRWFLDEGINIVALARALDPDLRRDVHDAIAGPPLRVESLIAPRLGPQALHASLPTRPFLVADIHRWAEVVASLTERDLVRVQLARIDETMCPRFHVDHVPMRLLCTYVGAGTEYLDEQDVDRQKLRQAWTGSAVEASGPVRPDGRVGQATPGEVLVLKGATWPGNSERGAVHRSPPASPATPRLLLTIDLR